MKMMKSYNNITVTVDYDGFAESPKFAYDTLGTVIMKNHYNYDYTRSISKEDVNDLIVHLANMVDYELVTIGDGEEAYDEYCVYGHYEYTDKKGEDILELLKTKGIAVFGIYANEVCYDKMAVMKIDETDLEYMDGFIYVDLKDLDIYLTIDEEENMCNRDKVDKALKIIENDFETINHYLRGDVFTITVENHNTEEILDECGAFYGELDKQMLDDMMNHIDFECIVDRANAEKCIEWMKGRL